MMLYKTKTKENRTINLLLVHYILSILDLNNFGYSKIYLTKLFLEYTTD